LTFKVVTVPIPIMARIGELDLPDRLSPAVPRFVTQIGVALLCCGAGGLLRMAINSVAPGSAVFALVFPMIMVATLFARWQAGAITAVISIVYAFYFVYLTAPTSPIAPYLTLFAIIVSAIITIVLAEVFRRAVARATQERDREIADRDLMLREFEHRVRNNFAIVGSMLEIQRRRIADGAAADALDAAIMRVDSIARAHRHLYRDGQAREVNIGDYLDDLCSTLSDALLLHGAITLSCEAEAAPIQRDRAVSIGLIVNELVTNAAKHAFKGRSAGRIHVVWAKVGESGWRLSVDDDGVGMPAGRPVKRQDGGGLGTRLIEAFTRQAGGTITTVSDKSGTQVTLDLPE
jgi:two-component sensor histidine kinase